MAVTGSEGGQQNMPWKFRATAWRLSFHPRGLINRQGVFILKLRRVLRGATTADRLLVGAISPWDPTARLPDADTSLLQLPSSYFPNDLSPVLLLIFIMLCLQICIDVWVLFWLCWHEIHETCHAVTFYFIKDLHSDVNRKCIFPKYDMSRAKFT